MIIYVVIEKFKSGVEGDRFRGNYEQCCGFIDHVANIPDEVIYPYFNILYPAKNGDSQFKIIRRTL